MFLLCYVRTLSLKFGPWYLMSTDLGHPLRQMVRAIVRTCHDHYCTVIRCYGHTLISGSPDLALLGKSVVAVTLLQVSHLYLTERDTGRYILPWVVTAPTVFQMAEPGYLSRD